MTEIKELTINGHTYEIHKLDLFGSLKLHLKTISCFGAPFIKAMVLFDGKKTLTDLPAGFWEDLFGTIDPDKTSSLFPDVFGQIYTDSGLSLRDEAERERYFSAKGNQADAWPLFIGGLLELVGEYLPDVLNAGMSGFKEMLQNMNPSKFQKDEKSTPLSKPR